MLDITQLTVVVRITIIIPFSTFMNFNRIKTCQFERKYNYIWKVYGLDLNGTINPVRLDLTFPRPLYIHVRMSKRTSMLINEMKRI